MQHTFNNFAWRSKHNLPADIAAAAVLISSAESAARGYALTSAPQHTQRTRGACSRHRKLIQRLLAYLRCSGDSTILNHYYGILPQIDATFARLRERRDELNGSLLDELSSAVQKRLAFLEELIAARRSTVFADDPAILRIVRSGEVQMVTLRDRYAALRSAAQIQRDDVVDDTSRHIRWLWICDITVICCITFLLLMCIVGTYSYTTRAKLQSRAKQLQSDLDAANEATKLKSKFLTNISHELRTVRRQQSASASANAYLCSCSRSICCLLPCQPMNAIVAMSHLLASTPLTLDQRECVQTVIDSSEAMMRLLNDLLLCSKMEAGHFTLHPAPCRIDRILQSVSDVITSRLAAMTLSDERQGCIQWKVERDPLLPPIIVTDAHRLKQVLMNLSV